MSFPSQQSHLQQTLTRCVHRTLSLALPMQWRTFGELFSAATAAVAAQVMHAVNLSDGLRFRVRTRFLSPHLCIHTHRRAYRRCWAFSTRDLVLDRCPQCAVVSRFGFTSDPVVMRLSTTAWLGYRWDFTSDADADAMAVEP